MEGKAKPLSMAAQMDIFGQHLLTTIAIIIKIRKHLYKKQTPEFPDSYRLSNYRSNQMIKPRYIAIIIAFIICYLTAYAVAETEIPRQADVSISGILLNNPESTRKILVNHPRPTEKSNDFPIIQICNSNNTEILTLVFHYGDVTDSFNEFRIQNISKVPKDCITPPDGIARFVTGKGIQLGISKDDLIKILGHSFIETKQDGMLTIKYKIDNFDQSNFLKKYNLPVYFGHYHFLKGKLAKFEFGFEYP
ncbi:hypothetical protein ASZ90_006216 [hydrocarbon metagenome]|uniref:Uncharacterized protein n=1 Tax=hydrocarbon metagenome TaxID=938273 RepID=A0A0W8FSV1_9ZZZZ